MQSYDVFYKKLIGAVPLKNVTSRFAMEKIKSVTACRFRRWADSSRRPPQAGPSLAACGRGDQFRRT
jgi:hypothetical protein